MPTKSGDARNGDTRRPNIVFILSDDQGPWAMGCAGNREIRTPNLDRLAATGIRFENFFCTSPVCSPARASLLTGRIPSQHGVHDWIADGNSGEGAIQYLRGYTTYTEILAEHGYTCGISGKWHLGDSMRPQKGFTHWYVHEKGGGPYYGAPMVRNGRLVREKGYITDLITDDALAFIDAHARDEHPFYLSVHYTAPHSPWINNHPEEIVASYDDCPFDSCPQEQLSPMFPWTAIDVRGRERESLKGYFAAVTAMDMNIGRILDRLEALGLREKTLVIFTSDNGFNCGHHGFWGKGNGTFPLNMYDTSVKVPAIMSHPGRLGTGVVCDALLSGYDVMPTLLDYVEIRHPATEGLPGTSFVPLVERYGSGKVRQPGDRDVSSGLTGGRDHVVVFDEYGPVRMIRTREWKYVRRYPYGPDELYDLVNDPGERRNLVADAGYAKVRRELKAELESWFVRYVDPRLDGTHEPVTGRGQLNLAGPAGGGVQAFREPDPGWRWVNDVPPSP